MTEPALGQFTRKPITGHAYQFDGTVDGLLKIFGLLTGDTDGVFMSINFGPNNTVRMVNINGGPILSLALNNRDWIILPDDGTPMFKVTNDEYVANWTSDTSASAAKKVKGSSRASD
jgi:hypothetical protein